MYIHTYLKIRASFPKQNKQNATSPQLVIMAVPESKSSTEIPRVPYEDLDIETFQKCYFKNAKPVIITGMTDNWPWFVF